MGVIHRLELEGGVNVMDEILYNALSNYYDVLSKTGYISSSDTEKLLLFSFYRDFVYNDYRGHITEEDYYLIDKVLNCLYGSTCLIPYPDYLKMGKLHIGEISELASKINRLQDVGNVKVVKSKDKLREIGDITPVDTDEFPDE